MKIKTFAHSNNDTGLTLLTHSMTYVSGPCTVYSEIIVIDNRIFRLTSFFSINSPLHNESYRV